MRDLTHATAAPVEPDDLRTVLIQHLRNSSVVAASGVPIGVQVVGRSGCDALVLDVAGQLHGLLDPQTAQDDPPA